jgi:hypothetical protein
LVTEDTLAIEAKGQNLEMVPNYLKIVMATNSSWAVPAEKDDRRYVVLDVAPTAAGQREYFNALYAELEAGGYSALLHDLLNMPLGEWHPRHDAPKSAALLEQKISFLSGIQRFWFDALWAGKLNSGLITELKTGDWVLSTTALKVYAATPDRQNHSAKAIRQSLRDMGLREDSPDHTTRGPLVPSLGEARRRFDEYIEQPVDWPEIADWTIEKQPGEGIF